MSWSPTHDAREMERAATVVAAADAVVHALRDGEPDAALESAQYVAANIVPFFRSCILGYACAMAVAGRPAERVKQVLSLAVDGSDEQVLAYASRMAAAREG